MEKIIHQIAGLKRNDLINICLDSWNPLTAYGFEIVQWNDESILKFLKQYYPFVVIAFAKARNHAEAADIARYIIVYHFGGCYVDWDVELLDIPIFLKIFNRNHFGFLIIDPVNDTLASECFAAKKGEQYLLNLTNDIIELFLSKASEKLATPQYTGPYRMRDSLRKHKWTNQTIIPVDQILLYDYWEIRSKPQKTIKRPLIHYWLHTWIN